MIPPLQTIDKTVKAFMLLFTAFQTASMSARFVTEAIKRELKNDSLSTTGKNLTDAQINSKIGDGYISMSLLYAIFAMANFFSPSIVKICGHKASMVNYRIDYYPIHYH